LCPQNEKKRTEQKGFKGSGTNRDEPNLETWAGENPVWGGEKWEKRARPTKLLDAKKSLPQKKKRKGIEKKEDNLSMGWR